MLILDLHISATCEGEAADDAAYAEVLEVGNNESLLSSSTSAEKGSRYKKRKKDKYHVQVMLNKLYV